MSGGSSGVYGVNMDIIHSDSTAVFPALAPPQYFLAPPRPSPRQMRWFLTQAQQAAAPGLFLAMGLFWHSWQPDVPSVKQLPVG